MGHSVYIDTSICVFPLIYLTRISTHTRAHVGAHNDSINQIVAETRKFILGIVKSDYRLATNQMLYYLFQLEQQMHLERMQQTILSSLPKDCAYLCPRMWNTVPRGGSTSHNLNLYGESYFQGTFVYLVFLNKDPM